MATIPKAKAPDIFNVSIRYRRIDGTEGSCISTDEYADWTVNYYVAQGYAIIERDRRGYCGTCKGNGTVRKSLRHKTRACPVCKGAAEWDANALAMPSPLAP